VETVMLLLLLLLMMMMMMMIMMMMQLNDEGSGRAESNPWLMTIESMVTSFCESLDNTLALMPQDSDKIVMTKHLLLRHNDVIEFRVSNS